MYHLLSNDAVFRAASPRGGRAVTPRFIDDPRAHAAAARWLRALPADPAGVAFALEALAFEEAEPVVEVLLADVITDTLRPYPSRRPSAMLPWRMPRWGCFPRESRHQRAHTAAAFALTARSATHSARRIRKLGALELYGSSPWWLHESLEGFDTLASFSCAARWHPAATVPARLLCMPAAHTVDLARAGLGTARLDAIPWDLPACDTLGLAFNGLAAVPEAIRGLTKLTTLTLLGNPLSELPSWLADLPSLAHVDARVTRVRTIPAALRARDDLQVLLS
jgi:hypothetical protein